MSQPAAVRPKVLLVDDDARILAGLRRQLHRRFQVVTAESGQLGLDALTAESDVAVVVSDMRMPGMDGAAFLARVRAASPQTTRVLLTGQTELSAVVRAINDGQIFRFLNKPCPPEVMDKCLQEAVVRYEAARQEHRLLSGTLGDRRVMESHGMYEAIATDRQAGLQTRQFCLQYQPIVQIADAGTVAVEAIVRWAHLDEDIVPESNSLPTGDIPGLYLPLGRWMLAAACQEVASWPVMGSKPLKVHVKLSLGQLRDPSLSDNLTRTLILSGLEPGRATLEISADALAEEPAAVAVLNTMAQRGVRLALIADHADPALADLVDRLPVEAIRLGSGPESDGHQAVVEMAQQAGVPTIAGGIDTVEDQAAAQRLGCDLGQGGRYGQPTDPGDLLSGLAARYH
jgi:EAL domain-containing protein (putative c-di-GMP-specific phosphodiesterase class I)/ActR/RegA family two-component response regulator